MLNFAFFITNNQKLLFSNEPIIVIIMPHRDNDSLKTINPF